MKDQTAFSTRFARHKDELEWLFMELYHNREGLEVLEREMAEAYNARSAELKALDKARSADPDWYKRGNMFGMTMYTDLFAGNLKELAKKLPYLKEQKLTYLHLMPLLQMPHPHNDGGYAVEDFDTVDPALGTNKDLENLTRELRKAGISLCLDFVMNHTASTHRWAMAAKAGDPWFQAYYHLYENRTIPDQYEQTVPQVFPNTAPGNFTWCEEMHKWVLTTFHDYQWDLNYANPAVFVDMTKSILHLANLGVEVFRIDAVPYIWKQLGTTCRNLPQVHTIVRMLRMVLECVCPAVVLKGEVVMAPKELAAYFGTPEKPECHMLYNVSTMVNLWGALASRDTRLLKAQLDALHALPDNCWFVNYLRCHDDIGWGLDEAVENKLGIDPQKHKEYLYHFYEGNFPGSWAKGELYNYDPATGDARSCGTTASLCGVEQALEKDDKTALDYAVKRDLLLHTAMAFLQGFPMLNCGDEIAQLNGWDYKNDPDRVEDSRNLHRSKFNWGIVKYPHPAGAPAGSTLGTVTSLAINVDSPKADAAADFINWCVSEDGAQAIAKTGTFPACGSSATSDIIKSTEGFPDDANSVDALTTSNVYLEMPYTQYASDIETILNAEHDAIMTMSETVDEGIQNMNDQVPAVLG